MAVSTRKEISDLFALRTEVEDSVLLSLLATFQGMVQAHTGDANRAV